MTLLEMQQEIDRLTEENNRLRLCPSFGIYTRAAIEISWNDMNWQRSSLIYADIDEMKALNTRYGSEGVNNRIKAAFGEVRSSEIVCARWQFGDELLFVVPTNEARLASVRIQQAFQKQSLSATFAIVRCLCPDLLENVLNAQFLVERSKAIGRKGLIISVL